MQVYYDWIEWIKHKKRSPASSRTRRGAGVAKLLVIGKHGSLRFKTPKCLVRQVPRYTSLATPQLLTFLCRCSQTGYESMMGGGKTRMSLDSGGHQVNRASRIGYIPTPLPAPNTSRNTFLQVW